VSKRGLPETVHMKHDLHYVEELFHDESGTPVGRYIPIDLIRPNPDQPRVSFGDLEELKASIREKGVLEPLIVRPREDGYQIVAGERRWRACRDLGMETVPCIEKDVDDREMLEIALVENLQRKDLSPFEEAEALQSLAEKFAYTHAQIARVIGRARTSVTESFALMHMPEEVRELCRRADISNKSLLLQVVRQSSVEEMKKLVERVSRQQLTRDQVREQTPARKKPRRFTFHTRGKGFNLIIYFNKSEVSKEELKEALRTALANIK
jgi:ParB family chromosome partitioning protein